MLPMQLLRVKTRKGRIAPLFCSENEHDLLGKIIQEFEISGEKKEKRGALDERIRVYEAEHDFKLVRGVYTLLDRRCAYTSSIHLANGLTSSSIRKMIFEEASSRGFALSDQDRSEIISLAASKLGMHVHEIDEAMWADFEENMVLEKFDPLSTEELAAWYNLSLVQTLLFNCTNLRFSVHGGGNWKRVLRDVKRLGLMYNLDNDNERILCTIEGPLSIFKLTDRYGTAMAKLLPSIIQSEEWSIHAWVVRKTMSGKKMYEFEMSNDDSPEMKHPSLHEYAPAYDSSVEEKFAARFEQLANGWQVVREPDPIIVEGKAFIPDFVFQKYGRKVYLEIVGFWTPEYLKRKLQKIASVGKEVDLLVAINEENACSKLSSMPRKVIQYRKEVPIKPVMEHLKKIEQQKIEDSKDVQIELEGENDVIPIERIAEKYCIPEESAMKILSKKEEYLMVGKFLVSKIKANKLERMLEGVSEFENACSIMEQNEIPESCHAQLISMLGFDVIWNGLDTSRASIVKRG